MTPQPHCHNCGTLLAEEKGVCTRCYLKGHRGAYTKECPQCAKENPMAGGSQRMLGSGTELLTFVEAIRALYSEAGAGKWARRADAPQPLALGITLGNGGEQLLSWQPNGGRQIHVVISYPDDLAGEWELVDPMVFLQEQRAILEAANDPPRTV